MDTPSGIGKLDRERITALLRGTRGTISIDEATKILGMSREDTAKRLARWASKGWLSRIKRGIYVPVPLESATKNIALEDPWIVADRLYQPCYIGGWSAAEYWGLTEQIFRTIIIKTTQKQKNHQPIIKETRFLLITTSQEKFFGLKTVWRGQTKVLVSDPARTILDLLDEPKLGGGIRPVFDMFKEYLASEHNNLNLLLDYAIRINNGAVFKRLGFLLERYSPQEREMIDACKARLTKGNSKLDPQLKSDVLVTKWRLWIPKEWKE